jgi:hypothetical protein
MRTTKTLGSVLRRRTSRPNSALKLINSLGIDVEQSLLAIAMKRGAYIDVSFPCPEASVADPGPERLPPHMLVAALFALELPFDVRRIRAGAHLLCTLNTESERAHFAKVAIDCEIVDVAFCAAHYCCAALDFDRSRPWRHVSIALFPHYVPGFNGGPHLETDVIKSRIPDLVLGVEKHGSTGAKKHARKRRA